MYVFRLCLPPLTSNNQTSGAAEAACVARSVIATAATTPTFLKFIENKGIWIPRPVMLYCDLVDACKQRFIQNKSSLMNSGIITGMARLYTGKMENA